MSKLYFLIPDAQRAEQVVRDLQDAGLQDDDIGILANDAALVDALPDADVTDSSDIKPALKQGAAVGGATGLLGGLAMTVVPGGFAVGGAALLGMTLAGSAFGAWASSLIGISVPHRELETFQRAIEAGQVLMVVSATQVPRDRIRQIVTRRYPDVVFGGEEGKVADGI